MDEEGVDNYTHSVLSKGITILDKKGFCLKMAPFQIKVSLYLSLLDSWCYLFIMIMNSDVRRKVNTFLSSNIYWEVYGHASIAK
jgi:hypothetical protein